MRQTLQIRGKIPWPLLGRTAAAAIVVPWIEETLFRGLVLGILLRSGRKYLAMFLTSALFSVVHFLKAPEGTSALMDLARVRHVTVKKVSVTSTTLDDVFLHYTGSELRDAAHGGAGYDISHLYR